MDDDKTIAYASGFRRKTVAERVFRSIFPSSREAAVAVLSLGAARGEAFAGQRETLRGADVAPLAVMHDRGEPARRFGAVV